MVNNFVASAFTEMCTEVDNMITFLTHNNEILVDIGNTDN